MYVLSDCTLFSIAKSQISDVTLYSQQPGGNAVSAAADAQDKEEGLELDGEEDAE